VRVISKPGRLNISRLIAWTARAIGAVFPVFEARRKTLGFKQLRLTG
jgi:hypothetical protein